LDPVVGIRASETTGTAGPWLASVRHRLMENLLTSDTLSQPTDGRDPNSTIEFEGDASMEPGGIFTAAELMAQPLPEPDFVVDELLPRGTAMLAAKPKVG